MTFTSVVAVATVSMFPSLFFSGSLILSPQRHQHQVGNESFSAVWPTPMKFLQPTWSCAPMCACVCVCVCKLFSCVWISTTPWTVAHQTPLSMGFSRQEFCSGLPFPSPGGSSWPRDPTRVSRIPGRFFTVWATREALCSSNLNIFPLFFELQDVRHFLELPCSHSLFSFFKFSNNP